jgi:hypothetical protein
MKEKPACTRFKPDLDLSRAFIPNDLPEQLVQMQSTWADALNRADGGHRHAFASFAEWQERLEYMRGLEAQAAAKEASL